MKKRDFFEDFLRSVEYLYTKQVKAKEKSRWEVMKVP
jgi:hypothetical protein